MSLTSNTRLRFQKSTSVRKSDLRSAHLPHRYLRQPIPFGHTLPMPCQDLFENPSCEVVAISAERTFWEKRRSSIRRPTGQRTSRSATHDTTMTFTNWL